MYVNPGGANNITSADPACTDLLMNFDHNIGGARDAVVCTCIPTVEEKIRVIYREYL